jgi:hypothetical protein
MTTSTDQYRDAIDAFDIIDRITTCDCPDTLPRTRLCLHTLAASALRDLLIDRDATATPMRDNDPFPLDAPDFIYDALRALLRLIDDADYMTDRMTAMLLDNSLCPMHAIDYAICFDDDDPDCAAIRAIHPSHDT